LSEKQIKKPTLISLIIGLILFISLFSIPFIIEFTKGISDPYYIFVKSFFIAFPCFAFSIIAIFYIPMFTWLRIKKNRNRTKWAFYFCSFFIGILIISVGFSFPFVFWQVNQETRNEGEIIILKDRDFKTKYGFLGEGTETNPYLIENLQFNTTKPYSIYIKNTEKIFVIRNCTFNSTIFVSRVAYGSAKIIGNTLLFGSISISYSDAIIIENNTIQSILSVYYCYNALVSNNTASSIDIIYSDQTLVDRNSCTRGLDIYKSSFSTISNNVMYNCDFAGIAISTTTNLLIVNNTCFNNPKGLYIHSVEFVTIMGNNCSSNSEYGIHIQYSQNITLAYNFIQKNKNGLFCDFNSNTTITRNLFGNNTEYGVFIERSLLKNRIYQNNFYNNNLAGTVFGLAQVFENTNLSLYLTAAFWYDNDTKEGNYWSDLAWDETAVYYIDGSNNTDLYPLENPVII